MSKDVLPSSETNIELMRQTTIANVLTASSNLKNQCHASFHRTIFVGLHIVLSSLVCPQNCAHSRSTTGLIWSTNGNLVRHVLPWIFRKVPACLKPVIHVHVAQTMRQQTPALQADNNISFAGFVLTTAHVLTLPPPLSAECFTRVR